MDTHTAEDHLLDESGRMRLDLRLCSRATILDHMDLHRTRFFAVMHLYCFLDA